MFLFFWQCFYFEAKTFFYNYNFYPHKVDTLNRVSVLGQKKFQNKSKISPKISQKWVIILFFIFFSVTTARQKPYTGVVGTQLIVQLNASRNIGTRSIKKCAEENDDFSILFFLFSFENKKKYLNYLPYEHNNVIWVM